uniref:TIL domain-containing protein n=1 Tax=Anopheles atroparvus TaxID=41427 RepID=A0AAG5D0H5_ANOAO
MNRVVIVLSVLFVMFALQLDTTFANTCPDNEEFVVDAPCDFNCQNICSPITDTCVCIFGYLRDLNSGECIPEDQCDPIPEEITLGCLAE